MKSAPSPVSLAALASPAMPAAPTSPASPATASPTLAWWRVPMVWLVISGPALVVVASFATLTLAILNPDPVLDTGKAAHASQLPAVQGRNHAATGLP